MNPPRTTHWPDLVFSGEADSATLSRAVSRGTLRRLASGIYTGRVNDDPGQVVRQNWVRIVEHEYPGAVLADRSVRWGGPDPDGVVTVVHPRWRPLELPGLTVRSRRGSADPTSDRPFGERLRIRSPARALLESIGGRNANRLSPIELEEWIDQIIATQGESTINRIRDEARQLAPKLGRQTALAHLDRLISAALTTGDASELRSERLTARAAGRPIDPWRVELFQSFANYLGELAPDPLPALPSDEPRRRLLPFFEAYFSNFIEGTEFTVDEAAAIVFEHRVPTERPADAHDILGTYQIVADPGPMRDTPADPDALIRIVCDRHAVVLAGRPEMRPGRFKTRANRAGATLFVAPEAVDGTLRAGFEAGAALIDPFARAAFLMFLVSEVHPFADGNGRVARIIMNAELVHAGEVRIIIPTVYRNNYLAALKAATNNAGFAQLVSVLRFAQRYTARIDFSSRVSAERDLERTHAFRDPNEADDYGIRLVMP